MRNSVFIAVVVFTGVFNLSICYGYFERGNNVNSSDEENTSLDPELQSYRYFYNLYLDSLNYFPKETPPIVREYIKNPLNPLALYFVRKYISDTQQRVKLATDVYLNYIGNRPAQKQQEDNIDALKEELKRLKNAGYSVRYFYSEECPYCKQSEPVINTIARFIPIERIELKTRPELFLLWKVERTPTTFFIHGDSAYKYVGALEVNNILEFIRKLP